MTAIIQSQKTETPVNALTRILTANEGAIKQAIAKHMDPKRLMRIAVNALQRTPSLQNCSMPSICNSIVLSGVLGLEPNTPLQHSYLIPYGRECTFQPGYRGLMHLAYRSASVKKFMPSLVYEDDIFEQEFGLQEKFRHVPSGAEGDNWKGAYSFVRFADGDVSWLYLPQSKIHEIRDRFSIAHQRNPKSSPWTTAPDEMAIKTVIKRHIKRMDLTIELGIAAKVDDQAEAKAAQDAFVDAELISNVSFEKVSEAAEDAEYALKGTRERQHEVVQEKLAELKKNTSNEIDEEAEYRKLLAQTLAEEQAAEAKRK